MRKEDSAVSPVVGVLLMLVVTIIIAAVVSGFAGGMAGGTKKTPDANMNVKVSNTGTWGGSQFQIDILGVSEPISTKDLKIKTAWTKNSVSNSTTILPWKGGDYTQTNVRYDLSSTTLGNGNYHAPIGYGGTIDDWRSGAPPHENQFFGNYSITAGSSMKTGAYGYNPTYGGYGVSTPFEYSNGNKYTLDSSIDGMQAMLGSNWNITRPGDKVHVSIIYVPTGSALFDKDVVITG